MGCAACGGWGRGGGNGWQRMATTAVCLGVGGRWVGGGQSDAPTRGGAGRRWGDGRTTAGRRDSWARWAVGPLVRGLARPRSAQVASALTLEGAVCGTADLLTSLPAGSRHRRSQTCQHTFRRSGVRSGAVEQFGHRELPVGWSEDASSRPERLTSEERHGRPQTSSRASHQPTAAPSRRGSLAATYPSTDGSPSRQMNWPAPKS